MKTRAIFFSIFLFVSCSNSVDFSAEHIEQTSGRYLYGPDEIFEVYYENNDLFLSWRGVQKIKPVILDQYTFFVADMYAKLRFVQHPSTKQRYLSLVDPENEDKVTYDYLKLSDSSYIPSEHLKMGNYKEALEGYLKIKNEDTRSTLINENDFNRLGYSFVRDKKYDDAIEVFKINVALYPESSNVYDSLADVYLRSGDSLQAYNNYKKAMELDSKNPRAALYINAYNEAKSN